MLEAGDGAQRGGLAAARRSQQRHVLAGADAEGDAAHGRHRPVLHDEVAHLDRGLSYWGPRHGPQTPIHRMSQHHSPAGCVTRRATVKSSTRATATASVCSSAIAAVSSVLVENHDSTMAGVMTLAFGPMSKMDAPSSRTLAMNSSSQAATSPGRSSGSVTVRMR